MTLTAEPVVYVADLNLASKRSEKRDKKGKAHPPKPFLVGLRKYNSIEIIGIGQFE
jgi:hypothetical protein